MDGMRLVGDPIFARDAEGRLKSRIGTMFFRTPGLVTRRGVHALQRMMWLDELNAARAAEGLEALTEAEENDELAESVDLIFTDELVLIRPDPERMDLAIRADAELQKTVSKRRIRYLNTNSVKVRQALCERGENWRMARHPISQEDMAELIERSHVAIDEHKVYYYNSATGTRYITASGYAEVAALADGDYRRQVAEVLTGLSKRNRLGQPEVDIFPLSTPIEVKKGFQQIPIDELTDAELRRAVEKVETTWRMSLPAELREESVSNYDWRNTMCHAITRQPNDTNAEEQELISGIAPEFYRQIEWLPGARIDRGEVIFDEIWDEAERTGEPELKALCDTRVKSLIFNLTRLFGSIDFINVGRIARSLARRPDAGGRRGSVYLIQFREGGEKVAKTMMIRFLKWGVAERLDEGKDLVQAILESDEYADYILDRRLMCRQLGMNLPPRIGHGHFIETYHGDNEYNGTSVRTAYFVRPYIAGTASDKIPPAKFRNPAFALRFASLMGEAAAVDLVVGRRSSQSKEIVFDENYETMIFGADGLPERIIVTDHAGSFVNYDGDLADSVPAYARAMFRRKAFVTDYPSFVGAYVKAFGERIATLKQTYADRRSAFDGLFKDRPYDTNGSGAYRWECALKRLEACDPARLADKLLKECGC